MKLCKYFPLTRIISLPSRKDRRKEMVAQLSRFHLQPGRDGIAFFAAERPEDPGQFPSIGAHGCFLSHLHVLREAYTLGAESVLIMEDDLSIAPAISETFADIPKELLVHDWDLIYLGYTDSDKFQLSVKDAFVPYSEVIGCAHFYAVRRKVLPKLIAFLEEMLTRSAGDPRGGPMHYDGALATFRAQNPEVLTLLAYPCLGTQRSSRSDIYTHWFEKIFLLRELSYGARIVRSWLR